MKKTITAEIYHLLHPKMVFFLTSIDKAGNPNVMTCAWATPVSSIEVSKCQGIKVSKYQSK